MKIAIIRKNYTPFGGAEKYVSSLIKNLTDKGHEIHIFANSWENNPAATNVRYHHVPIIKGASFLKVLSFAFFAKKELKKFEFDIIHSFERTVFQDIYRAGDGCHKEFLIQKRKSASTIANLLTFLNPLHFITLYIEKKIFTAGNYKSIIANSKKGKDEIIKHYNVPEDKIIVIYNGVDLKKYSPVNRIEYRDSMRKELGIEDNNTVMILFTGSGFKRKGLMSLIQAIAYCKNQDNSISIKLVVAGKGKSKKYKATADSLGIKDQVLFLGPCKGMKAIYAAADIFILPSLYEPFSNACCEAMAAGLPVVTSAISGVSELITEGENGYTVESPINAVEIGEKIIKLLSPAARMTLGKNARKAIEPYDIESQTERIINVYKKVLK